MSSRAVLLLLLCAALMLAAPAAPSTEEVTVPAPEEPFAFVLEQPPPHIAIAAASEYDRAPGT